MEVIEGWVLILALAVLVLILHSLGDHPLVWYRIPYRLKKPVLNVFAWSLVPFFVAGAWLYRLKTQKERR